MTSDEDKHIVDFWQKEAQYYESRAREQGGRASAAIIVACTVLLAGYSPLATVRQDTVVFLAIVPVAILVLWSVALRHLAEMLALDAYGTHAEARLSAATKVIQPLAPYRPWSAYGGERINKSILNVTVLVLVGAVSVLGTFGLLVRLLEYYAWVWGEIAVVVLAALALARGARWMYRNREQTLTALMASSSA